MLTGSEGERLTRVVVVTGVVLETERFVMFAFSVLVFLVHTVNM